MSMYKFIDESQEGFCLMDESSLFQALKEMDDDCEVTVIKLTDEQYREALGMAES